MTDLLMFWTLALLLAAAALVLRDVLGDDPRDHASYAPPRSHHDDDFARSGSSYR